MSLENCSAKDALMQWQSAMATGHPFDLVIMDYALPTLNGIEVVRRMRLSEVATHAKIVFLTGNASEISVRDREVLQISDVWQKPMDNQLIKQRVHELLKGSD